MTSMDFDAMIILDDGSRTLVSSKELSSCNPYFRAAFSSCEDLSPFYKIQLPELDAQTLRIILDYFQKGILNLNEKNIQKTLLIADYLNMLDAVRMCWEFIKKSIAVKNCVGYLFLAKYVSCPEIADYCQGFIKRHFYEVLQNNDELLHLSFEQFTKIIAQNTSLHQISEKFILNAITTWVCCDYEQRKEYFLHLSYSAGLHF